MADRTLTTLFEAERKGYDGKPSQFVKLTLESYQGKRYALYGLYNEGATKAVSQVSIREAELPGIIAALQQASAAWTTDDSEFKGEMSHADYALTLDWG